MVENLRALVYGKKLTLYQKHLAQNEFEMLTNEEIEKNEIKIDLPRFRYKIHNEFHLERDKITKLLLDCEIKSKNV